MGAVQPYSVGWQHGVPEFFLVALLHILDFVNRAIV